MVVAPKCCFLAILAIEAEEGESLAKDVLNRKCGPRSNQRKL